MHTIELQDKELGEAVKRMQAQIKSVEKNGMYSEAYIADLKAKQRADLSKTISLTRAQTIDKAKKLRHNARERYMLATNDHFAQEERTLFLDFVGASSVDALQELAKRPNSLTDGQAMMLASELRRRGKDVDANVLCTLRPPSAEPWANDPEWQHAELMLGGLETCNYIERTAKQLGLPEGPRVMLADGSVALVDELLL